jgi:hypothetical protein
MSRFSHVLEQPYETFDWVGLVSGPEIHRTLFEKDLLNQMKASGLKCLLLTGQPHLQRDDQDGNVRILQHLADEQLAFVLRRSKRISSRSGYSSLMDYKILKVQADVWPTIGQSEQEYLAKRWIELEKKII